MVRLALTAVLLMLAAPAVAGARDPVISYVDENGVFRLHDEEVEAEVNPPPPVPAGFPGFRYGMSLDGRYIIFNDAGKKLHLLDRATNTQVPLPGIDVYANPGGLTVSNTGLIAFDDNGNGPAVVYDSAAKTFRDTGLAADNGHRQPRLSGDGRFLGTTCVSSCEEATGGDADPFVQNLGAKTDTAFPDEDGVDEEHPCIDGDGSVFGIDKRRSATVMERDVFLFNRGVSPPEAVDVSGAMTEDGAEVSCVLDAAGEYVGFFNNTTSVFAVWHITAGAFLFLPAGAEFDNFSQFSAPYRPPAQNGGPGPGGGNPVDTRKPVARRFRMRPRRFRPRRGATRFRFVLSERANVRIRIRRRGKVVGVVRRANRPAGRNAIRWGGRLRGRALRPGRYVAVLRAIDEAGNVSRPRSFRFRILRPGGDRRP